MHPHPVFFLRHAAGGWLRLWLAALLLIALFSTAFFAAFAQEGFAAADLVVASAASTAFLGVALYLLLLFLRLGLFLPRWVEAGFSAVEREAIGRCYLSGIGVGKDFAEAALWFSRAAEKGLPGAQYSLGILYDKGLGLAPNPDEAMKWMERAAEGGHEDARRWLEAHGVGPTPAPAPAVQPVP